MVKRYNRNVTAVLNSTGHSGKSNATAKAHRSRSNGPVSGRLEFVPVRVGLHCGRERRLHSASRTAAIAAIIHGPGGSLRCSGRALSRPFGRPVGHRRWRTLSYALRRVACRDGLIEAEERDALVHRGGLVGERLGGGRILLDQRRILLG